jgi:hypothetical protein
LGKGKDTLEHGGGLWDNTSLTMRDSAPTTDLWQTSYSEAVVLGTVDST